MASTPDKLLAESAVELRRMIGAKEISPVELPETSIARIERLNPSVNAVTATSYGRAGWNARSPRYRRCGGLATIRKTGRLQWH